MRTKKNRGNRQRRGGGTRQRFKKQEYIHPALYQKQGSFGMSTFSKENIPVGTIIIREKINNIYTMSKDSSDYPFALIAHLLQTNNAKFTNLVPHTLDNTTTINYETFKDKHLKYLPSLTENEAILQYIKYKRNAFSFNMNPGILFYATKLNHSCNPHVKYYPSDNNIMVFETIRQINANEEVFDSYISLKLPREERQTVLMTRYGFECKCEKCNNEI
jgi:hypothetical protein